MTPSQQHGVSWAASLSSVALDRMFDAVVLLALAGPALFGLGFRIYLVCFIVAVFVVSALLRLTRQRRGTF